MENRTPTSDSTELQELDTGLALSIYSDYLPPEVEEELEPKTPADLIALGKLGGRLENAVKIRNGWIYIMLRRKVGWGNFKQTLADNHIPYMKVWEWMNYARAVQRFPWLNGKITARAMRHILRLDAAAMSRIEEEITGIPADQAKKITDQVVEAEFTKIQQEKAERVAKARKPLSPKQQEKQQRIAEHHRAELADQAWAVCSRLYCEALASMDKLAGYVEQATERGEITSDWFDRIFDQELVAKLGRTFERVVKKMHTPEELAKRAVVVRRMSFAEPE